ncbi:LysE family translocator [Jatrophihabitans sp.]|uniref:LysE family translocator n=1 Tax=Jatrophihabitans sp. TaxID=1932789 RepID=UPI002C8549F7|nr:LysE family translocator [Jatrophihabitans sp.]
MTQYAVFLLAFAASAAAPGPEIAGLLARTLGNGIRSGVPLASGIVVGKLALLTAAVIGLTGLVAALGPVFAVLRYAGAAYLIWLGIKKWRRAGRLLATDVPTAPASRAREVGLGMAMTLSNPIALVFYVALLPGVIEVSDVSVQSYLILCAILVAVMAAVVLGYGLMAELARTMLSATDSKSRIDRISAVLFVLAGLLIALR